MKIQCEKCGRQMDLWEILGYIEINFLSALQPILVQFFIEAAKYYLLMKSKGFIDGPMASFANSSKIKCSKCESVERWSPVPEELLNQANSNQSNYIQANTQKVNLNQDNPNQEKPEEVRAQEKSKQIQL